MRTERRVEASGLERGSIYGSRESRRHRIVRLSINETNNGLTIRDVVTTEGSDCGDGNYEVGSGAKNHGNSMDINRPINCVGRGEMKMKTEELRKMREQVRQIMAEHLRITVLMNE